MPRPKPPSGPWATLLRVAWLAIARGVLLQLALLLVAEPPSIPLQQRIGISGPVLLRPTSQPHPRFPVASVPVRSRARWDRCVSWNAATGHASATAAISAIEGAWIATPALASTAWCGCVGPTAPNSQATDP
jgi:hypothetical protein